MLGGRAAEGRAADRAAVPALVQLMRDGEAEVRTAAAFKVSSAANRGADAHVGANDARTAGADTAKNLLLPAVKELAADQNSHVRGTPGRASVRSFVQRRSRR